MISTQFIREMVHTGRNRNSAVRTNGPRNLPLFLVYKHVAKYWIQSFEINNQTKIKYTVMHVWMRLTFIDRPINFKTSLRKYHPIFNTVHLLHH